MTIEEREDQEEQDLIDAMMAELEEGEEEESNDEGVDDEHGDTEQPEQDEQVGEDTSDDDETGGDGHEDEPEDGSEEADSDGHQDDGDGADEVDFEPITVDVNGYEVEITSKEDMMAYIKKGAASFAQKPEEKAEELEIVKQGDLSPEILKLAVDAKNGSKEAIAKLAEIAKVDILDVESDMANEYKAQFEPQQLSEVDKAANEILQDESHASEFKQIASSLPQEFTNQVFSDANTMRHFSRHIREGLAQKIIPRAINAQMRFGGSFMDHYTEIGTAIQAEANKPKERTIPKKTQKMREKAASSSRSSASDAAPRTDTAEDVWDMTDEEFEEKFGA